MDEVNKTERTAGSGWRLGRLVPAALALALLLGVAIGGVGGGIVARNWADLPGTAIASTLNAPQSQASAAPAAPEGTPAGVYAAVGPAVVTVSVSSQRSRNASAFPTTGEGSGVIVDGRVVAGSTGGAVEFGHQVIVAGGRQCGCGTFGCVEAYCGTAAILERALRVIEENGPSLLFERVAGDKMTLTPKMVDDAAREGDEGARRVFEETGYYLGIGIGNAVNAFNPALVVLGGGIRKATGLLEAAERSMRRHSVYSLNHTCRIVEATLGEDAGVMGAAELAWRMVRGEA